MQDNQVRIDTFMAIIEEGECKIDYLNTKGLGVSLKHHLSLPYTLPGETVQFEKHKYRHQSKAILKGIVTPSPSRVEAPCKYFGICGGCSLQHLNEADYRNFKYNLIAGALAENNLATQIEEVVILRAGQRRRVNLEVIKKEENTFLGFHRFQSHQIINIDACFAMDAELSDLLLKLRTMFSELLEPYQKAQIFLTKASNGIDLTIRPHRPMLLTDKRLDILREFAKLEGIIRLCLQNSKTSKFVQETATPYIILDKEVEVEIDAHGFLQSSFLSDQILQELVLSYFPEGQGVEQAVDLFCGRGTYTCALSRKCRVDGFESDSASLQALSKAAGQYRLNIQTYKRDLFNNPLTTEELNQYQFAVINPPRSGANTQCENLANSRVERIVYVSCSPETFAADAARLCDRGYSLKKVVPLDQFYWSHHLEVIGFFKRICS